MLSTLEMIESGFNGHYRNKLILILISVVYNPSFNCSNNRFSCIHNFTG